MSRAGGFSGCLDRAARYARAYHAQPLAKSLSLLKSVLVGGAVLGLIQPAFAVGVIPEQGIFPTSGQGVYAALLALEAAGPAPVQRDDDAFSALAGFAQTVKLEVKTSGQKAVTSRQNEDAIFSELTEFAQRVGTKRPVAHEPRLKLADADNAVDALKDFLRGNSAPPADAPKPPVALPRGQNLPVRPLKRTSSVRRSVRPVTPAMPNRFRRP